MKLTFIYAPVADLTAALPFYRDTLGLDEAWREGDHTVAFQLPDSETQIMVSVDEGPAGPMYLVDDVKAWFAARPAVEMSIPHSPIPGGAVAGYHDPAGNVTYLFEMSEG